MFYQGGMRKADAVELKIIYAPIKNQIQSRLKEFDRIWAKADDKELLVELAFCILTPQSNAHACWDDIQRLLETGQMWNGNEKQIAAEIRGARFHHTKARRIVKARNKFLGNSKTPLKTSIQSFETPFEARDWLVKEVEGLGYKEASHFLRNIGQGQELTILDRHILRNLILYDVIKELPKSISRKRYLEIEKRFKKFALSVNIPLSHIDLAFWYKETGEIFK